MAKDFFDGLGESFAKTMREIGGKAESFYSEQKLKSRISTEEKQIQKIMEELGKILYRRYRDGVPLEDMQKRLCEQIDQKMDRIAQYKEQIAGVKSKKVCPSCGAAVDAEMAFCPHCGASCTTKEQEDQAGDVVADGELKEAPVEDTVPETLEETVSEPEAASKTAEIQEEPISESAGETVEELMEETAEVSMEETKQE